MFRLWIKLWKDNHLMKDLVVEDSSQKTRTKKVMDSLEKGCYELDLQKPIWLDSTVHDFQRTSKCRFTRDAFIESIEFDFMEIEIIEE